MEGDSARGDYKYLRALSPLLTHLRMDYGISQARAQAADGCSSSLWPSLPSIYSSTHPSFLPSFLPLPLFLLLSYSVFVSSLSSGRWLFPLRFAIMALCLSCTSGKLMSHRLNCSQIQSDRLIFFRLSSIYTITQANISFKEMYIFFQERTWNYESVLIVSH